MSDHLVKQTMTGAEGSPVFGDLLINVVFWL